MRLRRLHAVPAHESDLVLSGGCFVARPQLLQVSEVGIERGRVQHEQMGFGRGRRAERVSDAPGHEDEGACAGVRHGTIELELGLAVQDPERLYAIRMHMGRWPPASRRYPSLVQREGAAGAASHSLEQQVAAPNGQLLTATRRDHDSIRHEYLRARKVHLICAP